MIFYAMAMVVSTLAVEWIEISLGRIAGEG